MNVRGEARVGGAVRAYVLEARYRPPPVLPVLEYAVYSGGAVNCENAQVSGAPLGTPSLTVASGAVLRADVRVGTLSNSGTIAGEVRTGAAPPGSLSDGTLWSSLRSRAVTINYSSTGGQFDKRLVSRAVNPFGAASAEGIYLVTVPAGQTLQIKLSRLEVAMLIDLGIGSTLEITGSVNWRQPGPDLPALVVRGSLLSRVRILTDTARLNETINFNPASTPYEGVSDNDRSDTYPSEIRGLIHAGGALVDVYVDSAAPVVGALICEGTLTLKAGADIQFDPGLLTRPYASYTAGTAGMEPTPASWRRVLGP